MERVSGAQFEELIASPFGAAEFGPDGRVVVVDWSTGAAPDAPVAETWTAPVVVIGIAQDAHRGAFEPWCDVTVANDAAAALLATAVDAHPTAAVALTQVLRRAPGPSIEADLITESATYSALQASPDHRGWLDERPPRRSTHRQRPVVEISRNGEQLDIVLVRPERRNAYSAQMRDELLAALTVAAADPSLRHVVLRGEGPAFSSGGDLDEFGTGRDPGTNHLVRLDRSAGLALSRLADRITVHVHGPCIGAGVELPAFAHRVVAAPDTTFRLPELSMGLIPGAGGTASLPRRIGRHRTAWLALTGRAIGADTAQSWGLVDAIEPR